MKLITTSADGEDIRQWMQRVHCEHTSRQCQCVWMQEMQWLKAAHVGLTYDTCLCSWFASVGVHSILADKGRDRMKKSLFGFASKNSHARTESVGEQGKKWKRKRRQAAKSRTQVGTEMCFVIESTEAAAETMR